MKTVLLITFSVILSGCSTLQPERKIVYVERPHFSWEVSETIQRFGWHTTNGSIAIPERIESAKLEEATLEEVIEEDERNQKEYGGYWIPITHLLKDGGDIFWWEDESGRRGLIIKEADRIKAWRFVHYGPY